MTQSEKQKLLPCPFCGRTPYYMERVSDTTKTKMFHAVTCYCGGFVGNAHKHGETMEEATERWNTRAITDERRDWRPIADCPDDGTPVLLAYKNSIKKYAAKNDRIPDWCFEARPYCTLGSGGAKSWHSEATHWMPLPQPPTAAGDLE